jgi:uncharacterized protein
MEIEFDPDKDAWNRRERGLPFERACDFDFATALYYLDERRHYGETRRIAVGYLDKRLHVLCFVETRTGIRVISFRKANDREVKRHGKSKIID